MGIDKWLHLKNAALEPDDVCKLLNECHFRGEDGTVSVRAGTLRELVTSWLRVAAKYEEIELRPQLYAPELRELVELMLCGVPLVEKTEPNNEVPTGYPGISTDAPMLKCGCGYHGPISEPPIEGSYDTKCPQCGSEFS